MKLAIIGALAAQASAYTLQNGVQGEGMTQANEYSIRNIDEICVSTRPARMCSEGYVVEKTKNEKFDFHCTSRNSIEGQKWQQRVENNEVISEMAGKTTHVQGRVQVPTKCVEQNQVSSHEVRRRKHQQQHGLRVELIENDQQEFENQESQWDQTETDEYSSDEQYRQYRQNRSNEERKWQQMQKVFNQYPELTQKKLHQIVKSDQQKYEEVREQLKDVINQKKINSHLVPQIQTTLPTYFSQVAKQLYNAMQEQQEQNQKNKMQGTEMDSEPHYRLNQLVGSYEQYKQVMQRVYVYIVKEALKLNQEAPQRLANTPELVRQVWQKTQKQELTKRQIEKVNKVVEHVQELLEQDQTNELIADELVSEQLRNSQKAARRNLMRTIVAGLMMQNSPIFEEHSYNYNN